jgi:uncharacterized protein YprB with RNaseH-like and TPR domain
MNLKDKLYQINAGQTKPAPPETPPQSKEREIDRIVDGAYVDTPYGPCFRTETRVPVDAKQGEVAFFNVLNRPAELFYYLSKKKELQSLNIEKALFIDTETTGLAGGSGTYVILLGIGRFVADEFVVEQFFMRDYSEELAMLHCLRERLDQAEAFVSYNGCSYDIPLLQTRFRLARWETDAFSTPHLDLLYTARRLWKSSIGACNLSAVETQILKLTREGDIPGYLVPHLYFEYLQTRDARPLKGIFYHNQQDIISLAALAERACAAFADEVADDSTDFELLEVANTFNDLRLYDKSVPLFSNLKDRTTSRERYFEIARKLSWNYKRLRQWPAAEAVWREMLDQGVVSLFPLVELAKYYEHVKRDIPAALETVGKALEKLAFREAIDSHAFSGWERDELEYRRQRLQGKLKTQQQ